MAKYIGGLIAAFPAVLGGGGDEQQFGDSAQFGTVTTQVFFRYNTLLSPVSSVHLPFLWVKYTFLPHFLILTDCLPITARASLLHLLWWPPTQMRKWGRETCSAVFEWVINSKTLAEEEPEATPSPTSSLQTATIFIEEAKSGLYIKHETFGL